MRSQLVQRWIIFSNTRDTWQWIRSTYSWEAGCGEGVAAMLEWNQWGKRQERRHGKGNTKFRNRSDNEYLHDENVFSKLRKTPSNSKIEQLIEDISLLYSLWYPNISLYHLWNQIYPVLPDNLYIFHLNWFSFSSSFLYIMLCLFLIAILGKWKETDHWNEIQVEIVVGNNYWNIF